MRFINGVLITLSLLVWPIGGDTGSPDLSQAPRPQRQVAITFDDLPATQTPSLVKLTYITDRLLDSITSNRIPAVGFVNESKLYSRGEIDERVALLRKWLDAGLELGNHTFSHIGIDRAPLQAYQEDVIRGETVTRMLMQERGKQLRYFRHTQLRTGPTPEYKKGLDRFLADRGYTIAPVTIDNQDFMFAVVYAGARQKADSETLRRVRDAYVPYMEGMFQFFEKLSVESLGYEVKQVLLLHANELNADTLDALIEMMRRRGYSFITLDEALKDKAYSLPDAQVGTGLSWIHRWMITRGTKMRDEPREPPFISKLYADYSRR